MVVVEWLARLILVVLVLLSIWSVSIMLERRRYLSRLRLPSADTRSALRAGKVSGEDHFFAPMLQELSALRTPEQMDKAFEARVGEWRQELEKGLPVLGTLGSTTPFIGLLGTILGIIVSFGELSRGAGSTNAVMFSLAEALILTAVGLIVAIPAVIAYNYFGRRVKLILKEGQGLKDLYIAYRG
jgi:biopolymer transport protein ExbB/TolQ